MHRNDFSFSLIANKTYRITAAIAANWLSWIDWESERKRERKTCNSDKMALENGTDTVQLKKSFQHEIRRWIFKNKKYTRQIFYIFMYVCIHKKKQNIYMFISQRFSFNRLTFSYLLCWIFSSCVFFFLLIFL